MLNLFLVHYSHTYLIADGLYVLDMKLVVLTLALFCFALEIFPQTLGLFPRLFLKVYALKYMFIGKGSFSSEK